MSIKAASLYVDVDANTAAAEQKLKTFSSSLQGALKGALTGMAMGVGMGILNAAESAVMGIPAVMGRAVAAASDLVETQGKINVVMGSSAAAISEWSLTSVKALTMTRTEALNAAASFGIFGKSAGLSGGALAKFSTDLVQLAADLASFHNTSIEQATTAIGAALRGESEPIRAYGVLLDDASLRQKAFAMHITDSIKNALTPQQRVLAANALIMEQTTDAQGDLARTGGNLAGQQRMLTANMGELSAIMGTALLPTMTSVTTALNELANTSMPAVRSMATEVGGALAGMANNLNIMVLAAQNLSKLNLGGNGNDPVRANLGAIMADNLPGAAMIKSFQQALALLDLWNQSLAAPTTGKWADDVSRFTPAMEAAAAATAVAAAALSEAQNEAARMGVKFDAAAYATQLVVDKLNAAVAAGRPAANALATAAIAAQQLEQGALRAALAIGMMNDRLNAIAGNKAQIEGMFLGAVDMLGAEAAAAGIRATTAAYDDFRMSLLLTEKDPLVRKAKEKEWIDNQNRALTDQRDALNAANSAAKTYATDGLNAIKKQYEDIKSKASSVLTGALSTDVEMTPGPYKDGINENAKRLMAIANEGLKDQSWLEEFKAEVPDIYKAIVESGDPQGAARTFANEFAMGMKPELLDRDMAKQRIRDMILGETRMAALATELATEIATEMKIPLSDALAGANTALGVDKTGGLGAAIPGALAGSLTKDSLTGVATAIVSGTTGAIAESDLGVKGGEAITTSFNTPAGITALEDAGAGAFRTWWAGWQAAAGAAGAPPIPGDGMGPPTNPAGGPGTTMNFGGGTLKQQGSTINVSVSGVPGNLNAVGQAAGHGVLNAARKRGL